MGDMHSTILNFEALKEALCDEDGKISERLLAERYIETGGLYSRNRKLYDIDGEVDKEQLKNDIAMMVINRLCERLKLQPGDILEYVPDERKGKEHENH